MVSLINLLYTRVYLCFAVNKLAKFPSNPGKVYFEVVLHLLRYNRDFKNLGLISYENIDDAPLSYLLIQDIISTEDQLIVFYDSI